MLVFIVADIERLNQLRRLGESDELVLVVERMASVEHKTVAQNPHVQAGREKLGAVSNQHHAGFRVPG